MQGFFAPLVALAIVAGGGARADPVYFRSIPPGPVGSTSDWVGEKDYPEDALRAGYAGRVRFRVLVDVTGAVVACDVLRGTGHPSLDDATCEAIAAHARLHPGFDDRGNPVAGSYTGEVEWRLPASAAPAP